MSRKNAPEFYYCEKTGRYRKRVKNLATGRWVDVYGKTKQEVRDKIRTREAEWAYGLQARENPEVWQYAARWYNLNTANLSAKRQQDYANAINNHICPVIGGMLIRDVTYSDIRQVMTVAAGLSKSGQQKIVTALRKIFCSAVNDKIIWDNPCADLKPGGQDGAEKVALTREQQKALVESLQGEDVLIFVMICLYAGLRREEALGLLWSNVDLKSGAPHIDVRTACSWEGRNKPKITEYLKSDAAYRTVPIPPQLVRCLTEAHDRATSIYVIADKQGNLLSATAFRRRWDAIRLRTERVWEGKIRGKKVKKTLCVGDAVPYHPGVTVSLNFHVTPHLLRHTYITELILASISVKRVQYLAGHKNPVITLRIYTHLMENKPEDLITDVLRTFGD